VKRAFVKYIYLHSFVYDISSDDAHEKTKAKNKQQNQASAAAAAAAAASGNDEKSAAAKKKTKEKGSSSVSIDGGVFIAPAPRWAASNFDSRAACAGALSAEHPLARSNLSYQK
jgi:hypothetical protein